MKNSLAIPQGVKIGYSNDPAITLLDVYQREMKTWMYMCVHGRIIYDSQKGSNIFIYTHIHQLMNEWVKVVYLSKGIVFIQKKEISTDCASEWTNLENIYQVKETRHRSRILYDSIDMKCPE